MNRTRYRAPKTVVKAVRWLEYNNVKCKVKMVEKSSFFQAKIYNNYEVTKLIDKQ